MYFSVVIFVAGNKMIFSMKKSFILSACCAALLMSCNGECGKNGAACNEPDKSQVVYENIMTRRSVRKYHPQPVERSKMDTIIKCGINAPNGMGLQSYEVRVVDDSDFINGITEIYKRNKPEATQKAGFKNPFSNAPTVVFIAYDKNYDLSQVDCGLLGGNMILSAWSMGIGSCCLGGIVRFMNENEEAAAYLNKLGFSEGYELLYAIGFGYPDEKPAAKPRRTDKVKYVD